MNVKRPETTNRNADRAAPDSEKEAVVLTAVAEEKIDAPLVPSETLDSESPFSRRQVHVHANLTDLLAGLPITPEDVEEFKRKRQLNVVVHKLLTVGLAASVVAMVAGLVLAALSRGDFSKPAPQFGQAVRDIGSLHGQGFLGLGLLLLIATPILRVLGAFAAFLHERDWRYAAITLAVIVILVMSMTFGGS